MYNYLCKLSTRTEKAVYPPPCLHDHWVSSARVNAMHYLYIIQSESGCSKVGISSDAVRRLNEAQTDNHEKLSLYMVKELQSVQDASLLEFSLHTILAPYHKHREWFNIPKNVLIAICNLFAAQGEVSVTPVKSNANKQINKVPNATDKAYQYLVDNPDIQHKTVRELAEVIGVGKDSVSKAKKRLFDEGTAQ